MPRTKIICTIGPATCQPETLRALMDAGMDVARLNFSHGSREEHGETIRRIRDLSRDLPRPVAILQDLAGFKIRVGEMDGGRVRLRPGNSFTLAAKPGLGNTEGASVTYPQLPGELQAGDVILLSDGSIELQVESATADEAQCRVVVGGILNSRKGVSVPGRPVGGSGLTDKDRLDLKFGLDQGVDAIGLSFVRSADDVQTARAFIAAQGADTPIIAKIENQEALDHFEAILLEADAIMVARGDLGVGTPIAGIPQVQKALIKSANRAAKSVITATDMLRSMVSHSRPTRAEVTDVANSILDGTDAVMLSEETAVGSYPLEAVQTMVAVAEATEAAFPFSSWRRRMSRNTHSSIGSAIAAAVCELAEDLDAATILTCTSSGSTARSVARFRPRQPVLALTPRETTYRRLALAWGVMPRLIGPTAHTDELIQEALAVADRQGLVKPGDRAVITAGVPAGTPGNTNLIKVEVIAGDPEDTRNP